MTRLLKMKTTSKLTFGGGIKGFPGASDGQESARRPGFDPGIGKIPWRREWLPTPVFLPEELHGQRSLTGYSSWSHRELDTTE